MAYRDDLTALSARHDALAGEVAQKTRELEESRHLLEQAHARARLPVLDNLRVASPCSADWDKMVGDERSRHCGDCKKDVFNLSGLTRDEAEALLIERAGNLCVRYYERSDGTILLADCEIGVKRRRRRRWIAAGATLAMSAAGAVGYEATHAKPACMTLEARMGATSYVPQDPPNVEPPVREIKGEIAVPLPPDVHVTVGVPPPLPPVERPHMKMGRIRPAKP